MADWYFPVIGNSRISSGLGSRSSPGGIGSTNHKGIDIAAPRGSSVIAPIDLRIDRSEYIKGYGNAVYGTDLITGNQYRFAHLDSRAVRPGQMIGAGGLLGAVGSTGNSTGNHLHFEMRDKAGGILNPSGLLNKAKKLKDKLTDVVNSDTARMGAAVITGGASEGVFAVTDGLGLTGDESWLDQFKNWIADSMFFQRLALAVLAFILLFAAFYLFKGNAIEKLVKA
jgi:hypothetical protein